jgi:uncharacterized protein YbaP (TraB family)
MKNKIGSHMTLINRLKQTALGSAALMTLAAGTAFAQVLTPPAVNVEPAMYKIADEDTTIYVLGTIHVLPAHYTWFDGEIKTAFDNSDELVMEMVTPEPAAMQGLVQSLAVDPEGKTVRSYFDDEFKATYDAHLASMDIPPAAFDVLEPWMVSMTLSSIQMLNLGLNPEAGVESILTAAANEVNKPISGLETAEQQLGFFDNLSKDAQVFMLKSGIEDWDEGEKALADMLEDWSAGDIAGLADLMNEAMAEQPELNEALLTARNARWAEWVKTRLEAPGTVFLAVGAGHIGGEDSLFDMLDDDGITAERISE